MASVRKAAPASNRAIMADVRVAPIRLAAKVSQVSERCSVEMTSAPTTPTAAASVAVAMPAYMDPITRMTRDTTGISVRDAATFCRKVILGSAVGFHWRDSLAAAAV